MASLDTSHDIGIGPGVGVSVGMGIIFGKAPTEPPGYDDFQVFNESGVGHQNFQVVTEDGLSHHDFDTIEG